MSFFFGGEVNVSRSPFPTSSSSAAAAGTAGSGAQK